MDHRPYALAFSALILLGTLALGMIVPKGFLPSEDTSQLSASHRDGAGHVVQCMTQHQKQLADIVQADPNVTGFMSSIGASGRNPTINQGRLFIHLKDPSQRSLDADGVARELTNKLSVIPGTRVFITNPPPINIGGRSSREPVPVHAAGH